MALKSISLDDYPELNQYIGPASNPAQRMMAAKGLVPLVPLQLATLLFLLSQDSDEPLAQAARESFGKLPGNIILTVAGDHHAHPAVLHFLAKFSNQLSSEILQKLVLNHTVDDRTMAMLARDVTDPRILESISQNQTRLERYPMIANHLIDNEMLSISYQERVRPYVEMEIEKAMVKQRSHQVEEPVAEEVVEAVEENAVGLSEFWDEESKGIEEEYQSFIGDELIDDLESDDAVEKEITSANMYKYVLTLKTSQKIKLAITGNKEARSLLIKEANKMVKSSVIKNPRLTDSEVVGYAKSRSMSEDVLRMIAANREWMKNYQVKVGLASNGKTPIPISMRLISVLNKSDIQFLAKDKNVSSTIQIAAKRRLSAMQSKH